MIRGTVGAAMLATLNFLSLAGCIAPGQRSAIDEPWRGRLYMGNPERQVVERRQAGEFVRCDEPDFGAFVCMTASDFEDLLGRYLFQSETARRCHR